MRVFCSVTVLGGAADDGLRGASHMVVFWKYACGVWNMNSKRVGELELR